MKTFFFFLFILPVCSAQSIFEDFRPDIDRLVLKTFDLYCDSVYHYALRECALMLSNNSKSLESQDIARIKADCSYRAGDYKGAIKNYESYFRLYPTGDNSNDALYQIALCYEKAGELPASTRIFKEVLGNTENSEVAASSAIHIAAIFLKQEDDKNAEKYFLLAYENYPHNTQREYELISLALILRKEKKLKAAKQRFEEYLLIFPQGTYRVYAALQAARCLFDTREYEKASQELEKLQSASLKDDERMMADYFHAVSLYQEGKYGESERWYNNVLEGKSSASFKIQIQYALGWVFFKEKKYFVAAENWKRVIEANSDLSADALYLLSVAQEREGIIDSSYTAVTGELQKKRTGNARDQLLFQAGMLSYQNGNMSRAEEYFQKVMDSLPQSDFAPYSCYMRVECSFGAAKYTEAKKYYEAVEQYENAEDFLKLKNVFKMGLTAYYTANYRIADSLFTDYVRCYPADSLAGDAMFLCAEAEYRLGSFEKSEQLFAEQAKRTSGDRQEWSFFRWGLLLLRQKKNDSACSVFKECLIRHPGGKYAWTINLRLADISSLMHHDRRAIDQYRSIFHTTPDSLLRSLVAYRIGVSFLKLGDRSEAYKSFEDVLHENPHSEFADGAQFALAWINYRSKEYHDALKDVQTCIRIYPQSHLVPQAWTLAGDCLVNLQQFAEAEHAYTTVLEEYPQSNESIFAVQAIQYCLWMENKKKEALDFANDYIHRHPQWPFANSIFANKADIPFKAKSEDAVQDTVMLFNLPASPEKEMLLPAYSMPVRPNEKEIDINALLPEQEEKDLTSADTTGGKQYNGFAEMSIGNFFTPQASLWYGQNYGNYSVQGGAEYYHTDGYAPHTDQSSGDFYALAKTSLISDNLLLKNAAVDGSLDIAAQKFSFYGSATPEKERRISTYILSSSIENQSSSLLPYTLSVSLQSTSLTDSSITSTEHIVEALFTLPYTLWSQPVETQADIQMSSWGTSYLQLNAGISRYSWNGILLGASLHLYQLEAKSGQNTAIFLPQCRLSFALSSIQTIFIAYAPDVDKTTFSSLLEINRYLPASISFEHTVVSDRGEVGVESQWSDGLKSRVTAGVESSSDYLFFAQSPQGVWEVIPSGRTTLLTFRAEMVAKFLANDYFASGIILRSAENSTFGSSLPYKPKIEWTGLAEHRFLSVFKISTTFRLLGSRRSDILNEEYLPAFFVLNVSGEYYLLQTLAMQLDLMNVTNKRYELWRGYQEFPLTCSIGLKYRW
ncbi:MAG: tetratricopeptide repeat protein [Bacteroidota bacterium]